MPRVAPGGTRAGAAISPCAIRQQAHVGCHGLAAACSRRAGALPRGQPVAPVTLHCCRTAHGHLAPATQLSTPATRVQTRPHNAAPATHFLRALPPAGRESSEGIWNGRYSEEVEPGRWF